MSSTNKTTNYELSQFIGSDKPAWLSDYNGDMGKIDAGIHTAQTTATGADGKADANTTKIGTLTSLTTTAKTDLVSAINEVNTSAGTAQSTATQAGNLASQAKSEADANANNIAKFNLTQKSALNPVVSKGVYNANNSEVRFATDSTNSIFKVYGRINIENLDAQSGQLTVSLGTTSLRPTTEYGINCGAIVWRLYTDNHNDTVPCRVNIKTTGEITITRSTASDYLMNLSSNVQTMVIMIPPCLYFNTDFGDN